MANINSILRKTTLKFFLIQSASISSKTTSLGLHINYPKKIVNNEKSKKPVVLLLGWACCKDRYLQKYSKIYEDRDMITLRYTAPPPILFFRPSKLRNIAQHILQTFEENHLDKHPIVIHGFSNGGAYCYRYISSEIQRAGKQIDIKGLILDSAPGKAGLREYYNVTKAIIGKDKFYSSFIASMVVAGLVPLRLLQSPFYVYNSVVHGKDFKDYDPYNVLVKDLTRYPQLFLYSKKDKLIPYKNVEAFIAKRKKLGINVKTHCFNDSSHVSHYREFPMLYETLIDEFLVECGVSKKVE